MVWSTEHWERWREPAREPPCVLSTQKARRARGEGSRHARTQQPAATPPHVVEATHTPRPARQHHRSATAAVGASAAAAPPHRQAEVPRGGTAQCQLHRGHSPHHDARGPKVHNPPPPSHRIPISSSSRIGPAQLARFYYTAASAPRTQPSRPGSLTATRSDPASHSTTLDATHALFHSCSGPAVDSSDLRPNQRTCHASRRLAYCNEYCAVRPSSRTTSA